MALVAVVLEQKMEQEEVSLAVATGICAGVCTTPVSVICWEQRDRAGWEGRRSGVSRRCLCLGVLAPHLSWRSPGSFAMKAVEKLAEAAKSITGHN